MERDAKLGALIDRRIEKTLARFVVNKEIKKMYSKEAKGRTLVEIDHRPALGAAAPLAPADGVVEDASSAVSDSAADPVQPPKTRSRSRGRA
jgi:hypothetical protein